MPDCELIKKCIFFNDAMKQMPASVSLFKFNYCKTDNAKCARYLVFKTLGKGTVPTDLFPNQQERALLIIAEHPSQANKHNRWTISDAALQNLTPVKARDLMIQCFCEVQRETFAQAEKRVFGTSDEAKIKASTINLVQSICVLMEIDFNQPSREGLLIVLDELVKRSVSLGTPTDIMEYHRNQIIAMLDALEK